MTNQNQSGNRTLSAKDKADSNKNSKNTQSKSAKAGSNLTQEDRVKGGKNSHKNR
ncbi:MAG: hypothetical protein H0U57_08010 [Tatlockia sp.]|nr:hypothetical protein [Tatlockia sp.]